MYAVETLPPQYYEERAAAEAARRLAEQQKATALQARDKAPVAAQQSTPSSLQHALYHPPPPLSRLGSATVLGNIFQNFMRRPSGSPAITPAQTPPRVDTPTSSNEPRKKDMEELIAKLKRDEEMKRDTDIVRQIHSLGRQLDFY